MTSIFARTSPTDAGITASGALTVADQETFLSVFEANDNDLSRAGFFLNPQEWGDVRGETASGTGEYLLNSTPTAATARSIFGVPVHVSSAVPAGEVALVDLSRVYVGVRKDVEVESSRDFRFSNDETAIRGIVRADIGVAEEASVVYDSGWNA